MITARSITDRWPLIKRIVTAAERDPQAAGNGQTAWLSQWSRRSAAGRPSRLDHADFLRLIELSLRAPELATAQGRHTIASELPVEVALSMPRSAVDRADVAALLWACAETPANLVKLRRQLQRKARSGNGCEELVKDLDRLCCRASQAGR